MYTINLKSTVKFKFPYMKFKTKLTIYRRRSDNTTAKRKGIKGQTTIYKTLHRKPKIEQQEAHCIHVCFYVF
jgi:hypothetical protein